MNVATRIYKQYGKESIKVIRENPYQLAQDVHGIGFRTAYTVSRNASKESCLPRRVQTRRMSVIDDSERGPRDDASGRLRRRFVGADEIASQDDADPSAHANGPRSGFPAADVYRIRL